MNGKPARASVESPEEVWVVVGDTVEIGMIDADAAKVLGCQPGLIRLPEGRGTASGYGHLHIQDNPSRMAQITGLGFATAIAYVADVAANWTIVTKANEANRLVLVRHHAGYGLRLVIQWYQREALRCWSVVTGLPGRKVRPIDVLFEKKTDG